MNVSMLAISLAKQLGASHPALQKLVIHTCQPLAVSLFYYILSKLQTQPIFVLIIAPFLLYGVYNLTCQYYKARDDEESGKLFPLTTEAASGAVRGEVQNSPCAPTLGPAEVIVTDEKDDEPDAEESDHGVHLFDIDPSSSDCKQDSDSGGGETIKTLSHMAVSLESDSNDSSSMWEVSDEDYSISDESACDEPN
jgi:hypothetical protein